MKLSYLLGQQFAKRENQHQTIAVVGITFAMLNDLKQLEADAEYWRKLKALPVDMGIWHSKSIKGSEHEWAICYDCFNYGETASCEGTEKPTPEEAIDAYYKQKESNEESRKR